MGRSRKRYLIAGKLANGNAGESFAEKDITTPRHKTSSLRLCGDEGVSSVKRGLRWAPALSAGTELIGVTRLAICYHNFHLRQLDTDMDDLRDSFSSLKKGIKHRIKGKKGKADNPEAGGSGERIGPSGPPPRPGSAPVTGGGCEQEGDEPNADEERVGPSAAPDENKPDWKSTASASAKLLFRGVRDSADAFGPLKAVAGGLCFILENCEVWSPSPTATHSAHQFRSVRRQTNKR